MSAEPWPLPTGVKDDTEEHTLILTGAEIWVVCEALGLAIDRDWELAFATWEKIHTQRFERDDQ